MPSLIEPVKCKILGVPWNPDSDCLLFDMSSLAQLTKRNLVSLIRKFFDPLGYLAPFTVKFKILFQKLCSDKLEWDLPLPSELLQEWEKLVEELCQSVPISIPKSYHLHNTEDITWNLCGFCDASSRVYTAVIYVVLRSRSGTASRFVVSKTREAPVPVQTIPCLELLSALLLSRLVASVLESQTDYPSVNVHCYSDSQVTLYWIGGTRKEWRPFVQNRVSEIRRNVDPALWKHCPGKSNPADLPSRGLTALELSVNQLWQQWPEWLLTGSEHFVEPEPPVIPEECVPELKFSTRVSHSVLTVEKPSTVAEVINCEDFSDLQRLLQVMVYVHRAVNLFRTNGSSRPQFTTSLTAEELDTAERFWVYQVQATLSQENYQTLKHQLGLFSDDMGVWRCGGRLQNSDLPYSAKHPILLPRSHYFTTLIVKNTHLRVCHNGVKETLTEIRIRYWITKGRSLTKAILQRRVICRRFEGRPYRGPVPPPLPQFRIKDDPAFTAFTLFVYMLSDPCSPSRHCVQHVY